METLEALIAKREKAKESIFLRKKGAKYTIKVALGTCGIAAGARNVMAAILDELSKRNVKDVLVTQSGCVGYCDQEPLVEVSESDSTTIYGKVDSNIARKIVSDHIINGLVIEDHVFIKQ